MIVATDCDTTEDDSFFGRIKQRFGRIREDSLFKTFWAVP